jgi:hypothetical protein
MSEKKLKPCPFCGVKPKRDRDTEDFYISHTMNCYFRQHGGGNWLVGDSSDAWNRRAK